MSGLAGLLPCAAEPHDESVAGRDDEDKSEPICGRCGYRDVPTDADVQGRNLRNESCRGGSILPLIEDLFFVRRREQGTEAFGYVVELHLWCDS